MADAKIVLDHDTFAQLVRHLLPRKPKSEEAAFAFCETFQSDGGIEFRSVDWYSARPGDFIYKAMYGLELTDDCRGRLIKRAHDLNASLVEFHSHPQASIAEFSYSDCAGFGEFVPHVWWRLKGRPYAAVVMGPRNFDSLVWLSDPGTPDSVLDIEHDGKRATPTGATLQNWKYDNEE